jgi:hypothetical protein
VPSTSGSSRHGTRTAPLFTHFPGAPGAASKPSFASSASSSGDSGSSPVCSRAVFATVVFTPSASRNKCARADANSALATPLA